MLGTLGSPAGAGRRCWRGREAWEVRFSFSLSFSWNGHFLQVFLEVLSLCSPQHVGALCQVSGCAGCCAVAHWDGVAGTPCASFPPASDVQASARLRACPQLASLTGHAALQIHNVCKVINWGL